MYQSSKKVTHNLKNKNILKLIDHICDYCKATSFHGLKYIPEEHRHWIERALWVTTCSGGLLAAIYLIGCVWTQYYTSPTITSIETTHFPIWNIPFPAVTICNVNKVHLSAVDTLYKKEGLDKSLKEDEYYAFVEQLAEIIQPESVDSFHYNITELEHTLQVHNLSMENIMLKLTQPCSSLMIKCKWRGELIPCKELYTMHKSDAGFCCSFNYQPPDKPKSSKPARHVNGAGYLAGVTMLMDPQLEDYYAALFSFYGLQVLIHPPTDYPDISARGIILAPKKEAFLQVSAAATYSTRNVRRLSTSQRQCLFDDERHLKMGPEGVNSTYSYSNCLVKCRLEHVQKLCNCTPYFYPDNGKAKQCGLLDVSCLAKHRRVFINLHSPVVPGLEDNQNAMTCDCHPTCTDVVYTTEISQGNFFQSEYDRTHFFKEVTITNHSILHVYFKDLSILRFRKDVIYTWNDLLASFGGITGLCLGSSLLSFVELIYYFVVRPACNVLKSKPTRKINIMRTQVKPASIIHPPPPYEWVF